MADLSRIEKTKLEKLFGMGSGYVLDFSNRTFAEFVLESTGKDIYDERYNYGSGSKANRLRAFWNEEPNHIVSKLVTALLEYHKECTPESLRESLYQDCRHIAQRLQQSEPVQEIEAISPNSGGRDFEALAKSVREAIERNEPESGLDRLHTFVVKYIKVLCDKRGIIDRDKPLHSLFGGYVKRLKQEGLLESEMSERFLKSSISTMEAFNRVRNEQSFAHDNPLLNYNESLLICNHVSSAIRFIAALESQTKAPARTGNDAPVYNDEIPF